MVLSFFYIIKVNELPTLEKNEFLDVLFVVKSVNGDSKLLGKISFSVPKEYTQLNHRNA